MSSGATATNTRTVGGRLSTSAKPRVPGAASRPKRRHRTPPEPWQPRERTGPSRPRRCSAKREQARPTRAPSLPPSTFAVAAERSLPAVRDSPATRSETARRCRAPAPTPRRSGPSASPRAGTAAPPPRPRSSVHLPLMTSASKPSLAATSAEIIPVSLMGHSAAHFAALGAFGRSLSVGRAGRFAREPAPHVA